MHAYFKRQRRGWHCSVECNLLWGVDRIPKSGNSNRLHNNRVVKLDRQMVISVSCQGAGGALLCIPRSACIPVRRTPRLAACGAWGVAKTSCVKYKLKFKCRQFQLSLSAYAVEVLATKFREAVLMVAPAVHVKGGRGGGYHQGLSI